MKTIETSASHVQFAGNREVEDPHVGNPTDRLRVFMYNVFKDTHLRGNIEKSAHDMKTGRSIAKECMHVYCRTARCVLASARSANAHDPP